MYVKALNNGLFGINPGIELTSIDNLPRFVEVSCNMNILSFELIDTTANNINYEEPPVLHAESSNVHINSCDNNVVPVAVHRNIELPVMVENNNQLPVMVAKNNQLPVMVDKDNQLPVMVDKNNQLPVMVHKNNQLPVTSDCIELENYRGPTFIESKPLCIPICPITLSSLTEVGIH